MMMRAGLTFARPAFGIEAVTVGNREVSVTEEPVLVTPFGTLLRFRKDIDSEQPKVLVVAPLSGHFATLLRSTVKTLLPDHDVYITDWHNARDVPVSDGRFGFDDYVDHLVQFLGAMGGPAHLLAVCQPTVQALAAAAVMAESKDSAAPRSMTLMAGPVDCRISPTSVNALATSKPIEWFEREPDRDRAQTPQGRRPACLSGLRPGLGLRLDEHQAPHARPCGPVLAHGQR